MRGSKQKQRLVVVGGPGLGLRLGRLFDLCDINLCRVDCNINLDQFPLNIVLRR